MMAALSVNISPSGVRSVGTRASGLTASSVARSGPGRDGHHQFDLEGFVVARLADAGVTRVEALGLDTYSDADRFYSFRRATHRGEPDYGRQISLIAPPGDG